MFKIGSIRVCSSILVGGGLSALRKGTATASCGADPHRASGTPTLPARATPHGAARAKLACRAARCPRTSLAKIPAESKARFGLARMSTGARSSRESEQQPEGAATRYLRPQGTTECSHGWSAAASSRAKRNPWNAVCLSILPRRGRGSDQLRAGSVEHEPLVELNLVQPEHSKQLGPEIFPFVTLVLRSDVRLDRALL